MAKSEYHYFQGKGMWARLQSPDLEYNNWSIKVYLTQDSYAKFMKLKESSNGVEGILNDVKNEEDGYAVTFKRPVSKEFKGVKTMMTPPVVLDKDNQPYAGEIGNGSDVTVKVVRYTYNRPFNKGKGSAIRMEAVKIETLVPYLKDQMPQSFQNQAKGIEEVPPQLF
jgi:hypothetical protein